MAQVPEADITITEVTGASLAVAQIAAAYIPMAEKKMADIADEIRDEWGIEKVAILHRIGRLEIGEVSVAVAVASPHRKDGFDACKYAMDRLKQIVPIWKREVWSDGEEEWVSPDPIYFKNEEHNRD